MPDGGQGHPAGPAGDQRPGVSGAARTFAGHRRRQPILEGPLKRNYIND